MVKINGSASLVKVSNSSLESVELSSSLKIFGDCFFLSAPKFTILFSCFLGTIFFISFSTDSFSLIDPRTAPTLTTSPSFALISVKMPFTADGTSRFTLSVSSSTIASSILMLSPLFFSHLATVASVMLSPKTGTKIFSLIFI